MTVSTIDYQGVLRKVYQWPAPTRVALIRDLLNTLTLAEDSPPSAVERSRPRTLHRALGLLDVGGTAPSDTVIDEWLAEHRIEKYGP